MKDNFSSYAELYKKFRPTYPQELYDYLLSFITVKRSAWDCGTGNGQVAQELSKYFKEVYATDISPKQIEMAAIRKNIFYKVEGAEKTSFENNFFDIIMVAQAIHWFNFDEFYKEVKRTLKTDGILAIVGYGLIKANDELNKIINKFYHEIIGSYWDKERKYVDENYKTIPFPFKEMKTPSFVNTFNWTFEQLIGYINTWSAVQHFIKLNNSNPVEIIYDELKNVWKNDPVKNISFPVLLRVGKL